MNDAKNETIDYRKSKLNTGLICLTFPLLLYTYIATDNALAGIMLCVLVAFCVASMLGQWFIVSEMKKLGKKVRKMQDEGLHLIDITAYCNQPKNVAVRRAADRIMALYANGGHLHPAVDIVFYVGLMLACIMAPDDITITVFIGLGVSCIADFNLRAFADKIPQITRRYRNE